MSVRWLACSAVLVADVTACLLLAPVSVSSQARPAAPPPKATGRAVWTPARTADGQPDLQGIWLSNSATPLERPKALEGRPLLTDEEVAQLKERAARIFDAKGKSDFAGGDDVFLAALANDEKHDNPDATGGAVIMLEREFDNRTSLVVDPPDGHLPRLTPSALQRRAAAAERRVPAGPEDLNNAVRCITFGIPRLGANANSYNPYYQILQGPGYVAIVGEVIHDARIIPLDGRPHLPPAIRQWNGDSRGRWEGNTLVVDTTNFSPKSNFLGSHEDLHVVERFTRVAADRIELEIRVSDPTTWTKPWTALVVMRQTRDKIFEYACHEGNFPVVHDILAGARAQEQPAPR